MRPFNSLCTVLLAATLLSPLACKQHADPADAKPELTPEQRERANEDRYYGTPTPPFPPPSISPGQPLTPNDILLWTRQGTKEEVILDRIQRSGTHFSLTPADEAQLRQAGVSDRILQAMKSTPTGR